MSEGGFVQVRLTSGSDVSTVDQVSLRYFFSTNQAQRDAATYAASDSSNSRLFAFADNGIFTIYARIIDKDGGFTDKQLVASVIGVAPTAVFNAPILVQQNAPVSLSFSGVADPGSADVTAGFRYSFAFDGLDSSLATSYASAGLSNTATMSPFSA